MATVVALLRSFRPRGKGFVEIRTHVSLALIDDPLVHECIHIRVKTTVVDLVLALLLDSLFDVASIRPIQPRDDMQEVTLESGQILHVKVGNRPTQ